MRLTALLLVIFCLQMQVSAVSQTISFSGKEVPLKKIFSEIERQTGYVVIYTDEMLKGATAVSVEVKQMALRDFLSEILKRQKLDFDIKKTTVSIRRRGAVSFNEDKEKVTADSLVRGMVTNGAGDPIAGATITVRGKNIVTATEPDGSFIIKGIDNKGVLIVSSIGYESISVKLTGTAHVNIKLTVAVRQMEEVEVYNTGFQKIPKERATGAFTHIDNKLYNRSVGKNALERIYYVASGLNFTPNISSSARAGSQIQIRGISTINANMQPLIILDNFPFDGDINNINPNDIENISILKDATAASIWGVRSGNGVIVINTKTGRQGEKQRIQLTSNITISEKPDIYSLSLLSSADYIELEKFLFANGYYNSSISGASATRNRPVVSQVVEILAKAAAGSISEDAAHMEIEKLKSYDVRRDYEKYFLQRSIDQQYALSIAGGSPKNTYYASIGYDKNVATNVGDYTDRITTRINNTFKPVNNLEISGLISYTQSGLQNNLVSSLLPSGNKVAPYTKIVDENGSALFIPKDLRTAYLDTASYPALLDWRYRPLDEINNANTITKLKNTRLGVTIKYTLFKWLTAEVQYLSDKSNSTEKTYWREKSYFVRNLVNRYMNGTPANVEYPVPVGGIINVINRDISAWNIRGQLNINKRWKYHEIVAIAGNENREVQTEGTVYRVYGYSERTNQVQSVNFTTLFPYRPGTTTRQIDPNQFIVGNIERYRSYFANAFYQYKNRYGITVSGRIDGSNFYGVKANQRRIPIWSSGISWNISNEDFYSLPWLSLLKLRSTYGYNGNTNNTGAAYPVAFFYNNPLTQSLTASINNAPNPQLKWEQVRVINVGMDFELQHRILTGSIDVYQKRGIDLISNVNIDPTSGVKTIIGNNASTKVQGVELALNNMISIGHSFHIQSNLLFNYTKELVTSHNIIPTTALNYLNGTIPVVGKPLYNLYAYQWSGLDPLTGAPRGFVNGEIVNNQVLVTSAKPADLIYMGTTLPKYYGSFRNIFSYNALSLSMNIIYKLNYVFRRPVLQYAMLFNNWGGHSEYTQRWKTSGDEVYTNVPSLPSALNAAAYDQTYNFASISVEKGSHIRLQDIRLNYSLNGISNSLFKNVKMQIYAIINNVGIIWRANKYRLDPEYNKLLNQLPPSRTLAVGLSIDL